MAYEYDPTRYNELIGGNLTTSVDGLLTDKMGGMWYIFLFTVPAIMIWLKTESIALSTAVFMWTIALYGYLINPESILAPSATLFLAAGFAILLFKALSPAK